MANENDNKSLLSFLDSSFTYFNLKLQADKIKNKYQLKDSIHALLNFVDTSQLRATNP